jgi:poly(3-hydroxybutyrate) depolymerase
MNRVIVLVALTLAGLTTEPAAGQSPEPLPAELVGAWKKAGAKVGWQGPNDAGFRAPRPGEKGKEGEVPAFLFARWKDGLLRALPAPEQAFGLDLHGTSLTDAGLKEVATLKQLRALHLGNTKVTDAGLKTLAGLEHLEILALNGAQVTDPGLKALAALKQLRSLNLSSTKVTDAGLKGLAGVGRLETLYLRDTRVTGGVLKALAGLKNLHTLNLQGTNVADAGLKDLRGLKRLRSLNLDSTKVTDAALKELAGLTELRWLDLTSSKVTAKGAETLRKALPNARIVRSAWEKKTYTNAKGQKMPYRLLPPQGHDPKRAYPLVVFLDGIGSRGTDNEKQLHSAYQLATTKIRKQYPCFVVAPQCPGGKDLPFWNQCVQAGLVMGVIEEVEKAHRIDPGRLYATGLSDGGWGVWDLLRVHPRKFAAAAPICGRGSPNAAPTFAHVPIWVFHGEKDNVKWAREMVEALQKAGGRPKYTEYPNAGHHIWGRAYSDPKLFEWLFAQKRK